MYWPIGIPKSYVAGRITSRQQDGSASELLRQKDSNGTPEELQETTEEREDGGSENNLKEREANWQDYKLFDIKTCRHAHLFATATSKSISVWQTKPTVLVANVVRSERSLESYGQNVGLHMRSDALIIVVQTAKDFLITYSLASDPNSRVYEPQIFSNSGNHIRRHSTEDYRKPHYIPPHGPSDGGGIRDVNIRFRMAIRIDAGISDALVLEDEIIVATTHSRAIQCIRWSPDDSGSSHSTELLKRLPWVADQTNVAAMVYDKPMNLHIWLGSDGRAYAVQRNYRRTSEQAGIKSLFQGYCFHTPDDDSCKATKALINARFSLVAIACADSSIRIFTAKDYLGNIPLSHHIRLPVSQTSSGSITFLSYSPDGYALFVGFEKGWAMWSVYGKLGANSFTIDQELARTHDQEWLAGVKAGFWAGGGSETILLGSARDRLYSMEMARSSATTCFVTPNISRSVLQTSTSVMLYRGHVVPDVTALSPETPLWQTIQLPPLYLSSQWPIKCSVVSSDGKYIAAAGRRGLVHYSLNSGRWKTFDDPYGENEFVVRGGMCWYQHILLVAVEVNGAYEIRMYSREKALSSSNVIQTEPFDQPIIHMTLSGADSLLVYTYENILFHYIFVADRSSIKLTQVGQIAFNGIIRAPARVRSISWILPDEQRDHGEPSEDVATASVLFLVDGKLVLLQPSSGESGELKYDMRVIAHDVEHYILTREQDTSSDDTMVNNTSSSLGEMHGGSEHLGKSLRDSLWYFDGKSMRVWADVQDVVASAPADLGRELPPSVSMSSDFYPLSAMIDKGVLTGLEPEIVQRRDVDFAYCRFQSRTHLFIPSLLRHHLSQYDSPAALHLSDSYQKLPYFAHALEILLHNVLDDEVDAPPGPGDTSLLATVLYFLSSFPSYLDVVVGCTRKTEIRSWHTLFQHLPPVQELFEESLQSAQLKTAGGLLLVLHTFDEESFSAQQIARLLRSAHEAGDYELCKELARFLVGIDSTGDMLRTALANANMRPSNDQIQTNGDNVADDEERRQPSDEEEIQRTSHARTMAERNHTDERERSDDYFTFR